MPGWLGWMLGYAVAIWGSDAVNALLEPWLNNASQRVQDVAAAIRVLIPLALALAIGFWLRVWWWVVAPMVVLALPMLAFSLAGYQKRTAAQRRQAYAGVTIGLGVTLLNAGAAAFAAAVGVMLGRVWPGG